MSYASLSKAQNSTASNKPRVWRTSMRMAKYVIAKMAVLFLTVMIGLYLTILIFNLGGYIDEVFRADIGEQIMGVIRDGAFRGMTHEATTDQIWIMRWTLEEEKGLHQPFMQRTWMWFINSLKFDWGEGDMGQTLNTLLGGYVPLSNDLIRAFLLERLPYSLLLMGISVLLLFLTTIPLALVFSRRRARFLENMTVLLSSATSAPAWIHGVLLIFIFVTLLGILPYPRFSANLLDYSKVGNFSYFLKQLVLPVLAIFMSLFFQSIYTWRTFFLIYSQEDFVELGRAKGLPDRMVEKKYILRPTLPYVVTSFAMLVLGLWQNMLALEALFKWPGLGAVMLIAIRLFSTPLLLSIVTLFAYLMAITVFLLDFFYAWVDPRVRIDFGPRVRSTSSKRNIFHRLRWHLFSALPKFPKPVLLDVKRVSPIVSEQRSLPKRLKIPHSAQPRRWGGLQQILSQASGVLGSGIILVVMCIAIYSFITLPPGQSGMYWSSAGQHGVWYANPKNAIPAWVNYFRKDKLPETIILDSQKGIYPKTAQVVSPETKRVIITFDFDYQYDEFPQDFVVYLYSETIRKQPLVELTWLTPDGREIALCTAKLESSQSVIYISSDEQLKRRLNRDNILEGLFVDTTAGESRALKGTYQLQIKGFLFEQGADLDAEAILYGQVYGLAGTDDLRRDLILPLLSGTPVALAFGLIGAIATSMLSMFIAALGVWFGGWVDGLVQRVSEIVMTIPTLVVAILVFLLYSHSTWALLGVIVLLSIFGSALKNFRAAFLQVKEAPYLEAAQAQGAGDWRIIRKYLLPRVFPVMIPQLVIMVPVYVYYEVTLAFLGISDPTIPTWGRMIYEALENQAFQFHPHRILIPVALLVVTGLGFALVGLALDRVLNPRLRD